MTSAPSPRLVPGPGEPAPDVHSASPVMHEQHRDQCHDQHHDHAHGSDGEPRFAGPLYATPPQAPTGRASRLFDRLVHRAPRWSGPAAIAVCFAGAASYVLVSNPTDAGALDPPSCIVKLTTGLDCPGCGGTRAFWYLLHGNLPQAVRHHAVAVFAAPFLVWMYVAWAVRTITGRSLPMPRLGGSAIAVFLGIWAVFTVVRNIPVAPFTYLFV